MNLTVLKAIFSDPSNSNDGIINTNDKDLLAVVEARDNDGMTALHVLAQTAGRKDADTRVVLGAARLLLQQAGADATAVDYGGLGALDYLAYGNPSSDATAPLAELLLSAGANPCHEADNGLGALHIAIREGNAALEKALRAAMKEGTGMVDGRVYLETFDADKQRDNTKTAFLQRRGAHNRIPLADRRAILGGDHTTKGENDAWENVYVGELVS